MKLLFVSLLISYSTFSSVPRNLYCDDLKFDIEVTNTSNRLNNGKIDITIIKSTSPIKAFLYGKPKINNKLDVRPNELIELSSGKYILVLQNKQCSSVKRDIIIK